MALPPSLTRDRIDDPHLCDPFTGVGFLSDSSVLIGCARGKDLDEQRWASAGAGFGRDAEAIIRDEDDVGLEYVVVVERNIERGGIDFAERMLFGVGVQNHTQLAASSREDGDSATATS